MAVNAAIRIVSALYPTLVETNENGCTMKGHSEQRNLHFSLPFLAADRVATLHVGRERHQLQLHDAHTLAAARTSNRALQRLPDALVTHLAEGLQLPAHNAQLLLVTTPSTSPRARLRPSC
jgi:hypothetical protein